MKRSLKAGLRGVFALMAWPLALLSLFGKSRAGYLTGAHLVALGPGILGDYLRGAYYRWTLKSCSTECRISFGVIFSNPDATVEDGVYIGPYSVLGRVRLGRNAQLASLVQVLSGARQHGRTPTGRYPPGARGPQGIVLTHSALGWILTAFQAVLSARLQETEMRPGTEGAP